MVLAEVGPFWGASLAHDDSCDPHGHSFADTAYAPHTVAAAESSISSTQGVETHMVTAFSRAGSSAT